MAMGKLNQAADRFMAADDAGTAGHQQQPRCRGPHEGNLSDAKRSSAAVRRCRQVQQGHPGHPRQLQPSHFQLQRREHGQRRSRQAPERDANGPRPSSTTVTIRRGPLRDGHGYARRQRRRGQGHRDLAVPEGRWTVRKGQRRPRVPRLDDRAGCIQARPLRGPGLFLGAERILVSRKRPKPEGLPTDHARRDGHVEAVQPRTAESQHAIHGTRTFGAPVDLVAQHHSPALAGGGALSARGGRSLPGAKTVTPSICRLQWPPPRPRPATRHGRWRGPFEMSRWGGRAV